MKARKEDQPGPFGCMMDGTCIRHQNIIAAMLYLLKKLEQNEYQTQ